MANYTTLQADVTNWTHRSDLASLIPSFISLAEDEIFKTHATPLRVREMETEADLTVTGLVADLPADFLEARYIKLDNETRDTIYFFPPEKWKPSSAGYFTIVGDEIRLPTGVNSNLKFVYYAKPDPLATTATNRVLDNYYGAYLQATLKFAFAYIKNGADSVAADQSLANYLLSSNNRNKSVGSGPMYVVTA
jgi:hypothetical protein